MYNGGKYCMQCLNSGWEVGVRGEVKVIAFGNIWLIVTISSSGHFLSQPPAYWLQCVLSTKCMAVTFLGYSNSITQTRDLYHQEGQGTWKYCYLHTILIGKYIMWWFIMTGFKTLNSTKLCCWITLTRRLWLFRRQLITIISRESSDGQ